MLYHAYETAHMMALPFRMAADAMQATLEYPWAPHSGTKLARAIAAQCELFSRLTRRYDKPAFGIDAVATAAGEAVVSERVVDVKPFCRLLHFEKSTGPLGPRVLVVAPVSGHHATLLRGTVRDLLPDHDVYVTDWIDAREVPAYEGVFGFADYVTYILQMMRFLGGETHIVAVCQPTVPVLAAVSMLALADDRDQPRSMVLMGGPIDTRENPTAVNQLAKTRPLAWFEHNVITTVPAPYAALGRRVYPGFLQLTGFMSMNLDRHVGAHLELFRNLVKGDGDSAEAHRRFYDEYFAVMDLAAEFYLETIHLVFQEHALPRGRLDWHGHLVEPAAITRTAMMTVEGEQDDISAPGQTAAAHRLTTNLPDSMRAHHLQPHVGHYGVFNGRRWRTETLPKVRDFIRSHDR
ncbi:polyhydroxyalkanoate depolymerase [Stella sp.]|uniref:polyhydroxyalkanoate depolymerase n=1 Tax=Stella sp. TaxID=2912054 RepID=UPI0035B38D57